MTTAYRQEYVLSYGGDSLGKTKRTFSILNGEKGPKQNVVLMNSAAALVVAGKARDFRGGAAIAAEGNRFRQRFKET
ncbi:MAG: hypothetical protein Q8M71_00860 [Thermodesulfovibrionales bacterium]|nr:hypothetical protein [Thermodesulfovibrionales bacterium]